MPIYDNQMSEPDMKKIVSSGTKCACGGNLTIAWGGSTGYQGYILRCGNDINHDKLNRHDKKQEALIKQIKEARHMDTVALQNMSETQMMVRINQARFPKDLTAQDKKLLATAAITYGFDPLMGEISIYEGRPYISIDGRYRKAQETNKLDGVESRPATKDERDAWSIPLDDYFFRAEVFVKGASRPFVGWGRVRATESAPGSRTDKTSTYKPIQNNPQRMAEKRAEAQALRKSFHIPLPSIEDIGYENGDAPVRVIDEHGEIIEGEIIQKPEPKKKEKPLAKEEPAPEVAAEQTGAFDWAVVEDWIKEINWTKAWTGWIHANIKPCPDDLTGSLEVVMGRVSPDDQQKFFNKIQEMYDLKMK